MSRQDLPMQLPDDWRQQKEELIDEGCRIWEFEFKQSGQELNPSDIFNDAPNEFLDELTDEIGALKEYEGFVKPSQTELATDEFTAIRDIGEGGQGAVVLATDRSLDRKVAIKLLKHTALNTDDGNQLIREAKLMSNLEHPGVIPVFSLQYDSNQQPLMVMRYVPHQNNTMRDAIHNFHANADRTGSVSAGGILFRGLLRDFVAVCRIVQFAHDQQVVHRDLKPDNILVGEYGEVFVVDFGIAHVLQDDGETIAPSGTPAYMSPEQTIPAKAVEKASDIYGLGATLYHLLTGQPPFLAKPSTEFRLAPTMSLPNTDGETTKPLPGSGNSSGILDRVRKGDLLPLRAVMSSTPLPLEAVCMKAMNRLSRDRYGSAAELADEIERWLAGEPVQAWPEPWPVRARRWLRKHRNLVQGFIATLLVAIIIMSIAAVMLAAKNRQVQIANDTLEFRNNELQRSLYTSQFLLASASWRAGEVDRAELLLDSTDVRLRGIEWHELKMITRRPRTFFEPRALSLRHEDGVEIPTGIESTGVDLMDISADGVYMAVVQDFSSGTIGGLNLKPSWTLSIQQLDNNHALQQIRGDGHMHAVSFSRDASRIAGIVTPLSPTNVPTDVKEPLDDLDKFRIPSGVAKNRLHDLIKEKPAAGEQSINVWDRSSGELVGAIDEEEFERDFVHQISFTLENVNSNRPVVVLADHARTTIKAESPIERIAVNNDRTVVATHEAEGPIRFWHAGNGRKIADLAARSETLEFLRFLPNGEKIVWLGADGAVRIAKVPMGPTSVSLPNQLTDSQNVRLVRMNQSCDKLLSIDRDGVARVWDAARRTTDHELRIAKTGAEFEAAISPTGTLLAVTTDKLKLFNLLTGRESSLGSAVTGPISFGPRGNWLLAHREGAILIETSTCKMKAILPKSFRSAAVHPDGTTVLIQKDDNNGLEVWKRKSNSNRFVQTSTTLDTNAWHGKGVVVTLQFDPSGRYFVTIGRGAAHVWDVTRWQVISSLSVRDREIRELTFSLDSSRLITTSGNGQADLWDTKTGSLIWSFIEPDDAEFWYATLGPDGRHFIGVAKGLTFWQTEP